MAFFYLLLALAALLLASGALAVWRLWRRHTLMPYRVEGRLFSPGEADLLAALDAAVGGQRRVFGKVLVEDVVAVQRRGGRQLRERAYERLAERRFDFIICDARSLRVLCAVDLIGDERRLFGTGSHRALERVCRAAGLPLVTVEAAEHYDPTELAESLAAAIALPQDTAPRPESEAPQPRETALNRPGLAHDDDPADRQDEERLLAELAAAIRNKDAED